MAGPRSDPPMPMLTMSVIFLPVAPGALPERTASAKAPIASSTERTSAFTSCPSSTIPLPVRLRSAVCSTARSSVMLIFLPENIAARRPSRSAALASFPSRSIVSSIDRAFRPVEQKVGVGGGEFLEALRIGGESLAHGARRCSHGDRATRRAVFRRTIDPLPHSKSLGTPQYRPDVSGKCRRAGVSKLPIGFNAH